MPGTPRVSNDGDLGGLLEARVYAVDGGCVLLFDTTDSEGASGDWRWDFHKVPCRGVIFRGRDLFAGPHLEASGMKRDASSQFAY